MKQQREPALPADEGLKKMGCRRLSGTFTGSQLLPFGDGVGGRCERDRSAAERPQREHQERGGREAQQELEPQPSGRPILRMRCGWPAGAHGQPPLAALGNVARWRGEGPCEGNRSRVGLAPPAAPVRPPRACRWWARGARLIAGAGPWCLECAVIELVMDTSCQRMRPRAAAQGVTCQRELPPVSKPLRKTMWSKAGQSGLPVATVADSTWSMPPLAGL